MKKQIVYLSLLIALIVLVLLPCSIALSETYQKAIFPFSGSLTITQGADGFNNRFFIPTETGNWWLTHQPSKYNATYMMYALDVTQNGNLIAYAPFDAEVVYRGEEQYGNEVVLQSIKEVLLADGTYSKVFMRFVHANSSDVSQLVQGKKLLQNEAFYHEGTSGNVTGSHIHVEVGKGEWTNYTNEIINYKYKMSDNGGWLPSNSYINYLKKGVDPTSTLYLNEGTTFSQGWAGGFSFKSAEFNNAWTSTTTVVLPYTPNWSGAWSQWQTDNDAHMGERFSIPVSASFATLGCFLSTDRESVVWVTPSTVSSYTNVWSVSEDASGYATASGTNCKYIDAYYTAQGTGTNGFGRTLAPSTTYYFKFFGTMAGNSSIYYSPEIHSFTTSGATPVYGINASPATLDFGTAVIGYAQPSAQTVTITNTGNQSITLNQPTATNYIISTLGTTTIGAGSTATFSVRPNANLSAGTYNVPISITGSNGVNASVTAQFRVNSYSISLSPATLDFGTLNVGYGTQTGKAVTITNTGNQSVTLNTLGAPANYNFSWGSKTTLAAGENTTLTVTPSTGLTAGNYDTQVFISSTNTTAVAALNLKLTVDRVPVAPTITTDSLPNGTVNTSYTTQQLIATGDTPFTWSHSSGSLPTGLTLSSNGLLGGTPTQAGTFTFTVSVSNGISPSATKQYTITIYAAPTYTMSFAASSIDLGSAITGYNRYTYGQFATIHNTGNQTITIGESPQWQYFQLDGVQTNPLPSGSSTICVIQPKEGLSAGNYSEALTITGTNGATATIQASFVVTTPSYAISAAPTTLLFGSLNIGYTQPAAQTVTITNTGNQSVTLSQPTATNYALSNLNATTLAAGAIATFAVQPKPNLLAGTYNETISITGSNGVSESVTVQFQVNTPAEYRISAAPATLSFGSLNTGYTQPTAQTVTITNTGNQSVTLNQPTATNYALSNLNVTTLAAGATATFAVQPKPNLPAGTYNETINIVGSNGVSASVSAQFQVSTPPSPTVQVSPSATIMLGNAGIVNLTIGSNITGFNANNFMYLHMDGVNVLPSNSTFIVRDGSIIIQMNPIYLNTLSLGSHVVTIGLQGSGYENTKVSTTIMVVTNPSVVPPKTGDSTPIAFLAMLMLLSAFGIGFTLKGKTWRKAS